MSTDVRRPLALVEPIAERIVDALSPYCERLCLAGSIRRGAELIGDVELLVIPKRRQQVVGLPGFDVATTPAGALIDELDEQLRLRLLAGSIRRRPDARGRTFWGPSDKRLLWRYGPSSDDWIAVDVFGATPETWGTKVLLRTGPAELSHRLVSPRKHGGLLAPDLKFADGGLYQHFADVGWRFVPTPDEETALATLRLPYVAPEHRTSTTWGDLVAARRSV